MNGFRKLLAVGSIVALLGIYGCEKKLSKPLTEHPYIPEQSALAPTPSFVDLSSIHKLEFVDGYILRQERPRREFKHNNIKNYDNLYLGAGDQRTQLRDNGCDGTVDMIDSLDTYIRGEPGTDEMFKKADEDLKIAKKELGIK